ncbi:DUF262 domain-containing protein [Leisingera aquaemixtae]|uniref:DUF262 domain-containing protein n=1 Tax=Leisingera aquaemixtae TaxID=1396826 RepID=UPI001C956E63|nr:DUF262 domain-containing protein [Leisingera aquaemixtae]MBY6069528.1 DUF262 domain-containing protein [Leisingera aquaemixtae]
MSEADDNGELFDATEESVELELTGASFEGLLIQPADWTIGSLYTQIGRQIDLNPAFQRRNVWTDTAKSNFIESILVGIPIPQILLSSRADKKNSYLVLDGKQRLLALKGFIENEFPLRKLRILRDLEGKKWQDIEGEEDWSDRLMNETQRTAVIKNWTNEKVLYEIFYRLNSGSVKLSPMELRMSLHPGTFLKFIVEWTEELSSLHTLLGKKKPDPRMSDVELSIRHLAFSTGITPYNGDLKAFLDQTCVEFNDRFDNEEGYKQRIEGNLDDMTAAIRAGLDIFPNRTFCRKFSEGAYETRFNRAVFDVQVGALANQDVREAAVAGPERFRSVYEAVATRGDFTRSVEFATKTPFATRTRFDLFYQAINQEYGTDLETPNIQEGEQ